jgi:hypothetical protein
VHLDIDEHIAGTGDDTPRSLVQWLKDGTDQHVRVALGPDNSFFAWDSKRVRWEGIPNNLQESIQGWLGPAGWISGPPRIVCLGCNGAYFALSEYGAAAWKSPGAESPIDKTWKELKAQNAAGTFKFSDLDVSVPRYV